MQCNVCHRYHEGPLNYHRRPATAGALRPRSTLQYSRTLPNGAPARAAPGEADDVAGVAPPSAWTRSQVFGGHAATQVMSCDVMYSSVSQVFGGDASAPPIAVVVVGRVLALRAPGSPVAS